MNLLDLEDEKFKNVTVRGLNFKIRFISPWDRVQITRERMQLQGGNPIDALTEADFLYFENIAMVNVCTENMPDGFKQNISCIKWDDIGLINELAGEIRQHTSDIEAKLKKNRPIE